MLDDESGYQDKEVVYSQATMGEDARGTIASMKASREKREPVDCFLGETVGLPFLELELFWVALELDHQIKSGERLLLGQDLPDEILSMEAFLVEEALSFLVVGLDASLERAALMVTLDVFRKKPRAAA